MFNYNKMYLLYVCVLNKREAQYPKWICKIKTNEIENRYLKHYKNKYASFGEKNKQIEVDARNNYD